MESCNSRLNKNIIKNKNNTINAFSIQINNLINLYFAADKYKAPIFSKTKALSKV